MKESPAIDVSYLGQRIFIKTYGCQMNVYDSQRMSDSLAYHGYEQVAQPDEADVLLLNTCHIREKATEKLYSELETLRELKDRAALLGRKVLIAIAGCVAQAEGHELMRRSSALDLVFGPGVYHRIGQLLERAAHGERVLELEFPAEDKFHALPAPSEVEIISRGPSAFLTIQEGCDKFCTFCVVPYTRGVEVSRPVGSILDEARHLADAGVIEIVLLGQNVNAYHGSWGSKGSADLADLLGCIADIPGIKRLRYTTSHPRDMRDSLIEAHGQIPALLPYLHLPVQSGSDRILAAMNRRHTAAHYKQIVSRLRAVRPDIALASDFIVGFPGEGEAEFEETLALVREVRFAQAYSFKYSPRPGTPAATMDGMIPDNVQKERLLRLQEEIQEQQRAFNEAMVGEVMPVLFDRVDRRPDYPDRLGGRTPYGQTIYADASASLRGTLQNVKVTGVRPNGLLGVLADNELLS